MYELSCLSRAYLSVQSIHIRLILSSMLVELLNAGENLKLYKCIRFHAKFINDFKLSVSLITQEINMWSLELLRV
jgi:hypothetical protein